jgi:hypothetical protein
MKQYYVSKIAQANGDHEVHEGNCKYLPKLENRIYLGAFDSCKEAVRAANVFYVKVNGCVYCSTPCHTQ